MAHAVPLVPLPWHYCFIVSIVLRKYNAFFMVENTHFPGEIASNGRLSLVTAPLRLLCFFMQLFFLGASSAFP